MNNAIVSDSACHGSVAARWPILKLLYPSSFAHAVVASAVLHGSIIFGFITYFTPPPSALAGSGPIYEVTFVNPGLVGWNAMASMSPVEHRREPTMRTTAPTISRPKTAEVSLSSKSTRARPRLTAEATRPSPATSTAPQQEPASSQSIGNGGSGGGTLAPLGGSGGAGGTRFKVSFAPKPPYPPAARRAGFEGRVVLNLTIDPEGRPRAVSVAESSGRKDCDDSASTTILNRWRFEPLSNYRGEINERIAVRYQLQ